MIAVPPLAAGYFSFGYLAPLVCELLIFLTLALSLQLINGCAGMFSLGHQGFFGVGAYAAGAVVVYAMPSLRGALGTGAAYGITALAASVVAGGLAATLFGLIVGVPCLRLKGDYLAIATLGFAEIFRIAVTNTKALGGALGLKVPEVLYHRTPDEKVAYYALYAAAGAALAALTYVVIRNIMRSSHGRAIYAIREDEVAAELLGVDLTRYKVVVFCVGAGFAGLAGGLFANYTLGIAPTHFQLMFGVVLLLYVVLGGLGSLGGCIVATIALFSLERFLAAMESYLGTWWQVDFALLLVVIVIARPQGLLGKKSA